MGKMIDGQWTTEWYAPDAEGRFRREQALFHGRITRDASSEHPAVAGRYHLYVSYACPWAHRTLILRRLKGLEKVISLSVVNPLMGDDGWTFEDGDGVVPDPIGGVTFLRDVYRAARPDYTGRVTVPILWDREAHTIVNNESREIIRMLDCEFEGIATRDVTFCPSDLRDTIDEVIDAIYEPINNGVYKTGFATTQSAYEEAVGELFEALDHWEGVLARQRYLCGDRITEADWCLYTTLVRFDLVYHYHFKCNLRRISDYPNLSGYLRELYQVPGVAEITHFDHIKNHYYWSHESINPHRVIPVGPEIDLTAPHGRDPL